MFYLSSGHGGLLVLDPHCHQNTSFEQNWLVESNSVAQINEITIKRNRDIIENVF